MTEAAATITSHMSPNTPLLGGVPVTKTFVIFSALLYVISESMDWQDEIALDGEKILNDGQWHRLFIYHLTFGSIGELILGTASLAPLMRRFEREMGSRRFGSFLYFKCLPIATMIQLALIIMLDMTAVPFCGPYPYLGAMLILYHLYTPRLHPKFFSILGFDFSEKSFVYAFAFQVIYSGGWIGTVFPSLAGMIAGYFCIRKTILELEYVPTFIFSFASNYLTFFADDNVNQLYVTRAVARNLTPHHQHDAGINRNDNNTRQRPNLQEQHLAAARFTRQQPPPPPPPSEEAIEQLTSMGFDREAVINALRATDNNVEAAANRLLTN